MSHVVPAPLSSWLSSNTSGSALRMLLAVSTNCSAFYDKHVYNVQVHIHVHHNHLIHANKTVTKFVCTSPLVARVSSRPATAAVDWGEMSSGLDVKASS